MLGSLALGKKARKVSDEKYAGSSQLPVHFRVREAGKQKHCASTGLLMSTVCPHCLHTISVLGGRAIWALVKKGEAVHHTHLSLSAALLSFHDCRGHLIRTKIKTKAEQCGWSSNRPSLVLPPFVFVPEALIIPEADNGIRGPGSWETQLTWGGCRSKAPTGWAEWVFVGSILAGFSSKATEETAPSCRVSRPKHATTGSGWLLKKKNKMREG